MSMTQTLLAVQQALSPEECERLLERFVEHHPRWRGADVADVLDALCDSDAHLDLTEPMFAAHAAEVPERSLLTLATLAVAYLDGPHEVTWERVRELVCRVRDLNVLNAPAAGAQP